jgi:hypothetical protein
MPISPDIAALFSERFPRYALSLMSWPDEPEPLLPPDPEWQKNLPLQHAQVLYLYGIGDGSAAVQLRYWLKEKPQRRLIFLEPRQHRIVQFLQQPLAKEVLQERQVEIYHLPARQEKSHLIQEMAERFPFGSVFLSPHPSLPSSEKRAFSRTHLQLMRKTAQTHSHFIDRRYHHLPLQNLLQNLRHLPTAFYVNAMKDAFQDVPAIICGAGPSLQHSIEELRQMENRALIFAGGSAIAALSSQGISPHFAIAVDPNEDEMQRLQNSFAFEAPFLFATRLYKDGLAACNGPFGYVRSGMAGIEEIWFEEELGLLEPILGAHLSADALTVTALAAAIAYHFGCNPILFDGLDLAYTGSCRYADGVMAPEETQKTLQPADRLIARRDRHGKKVTSAVRWVMESSGLAKLVRRHRDRRWVNCTAGGLGIPGVEAKNLSEMRAGFSQARDLRGEIHRAIQHSPMPPNTASILTEKTGELCRSLQSVLKHLEILARDDNRGRSALAEIELRDELAYSIIFFDVEKTIHAATMSEKKDRAFWQMFYEIARECLNLSW